jgi:hypothetical protein
MPEEHRATASREGADPALQGHAQKNICQTDPHGCDTETYEWHHLDVPATLAKADTWHVWVDWVYAPEVEKEFTLVCLDRKPLVIWPFAQGPPPQTALEYRIALCSFLC